MNDAPPPSKKRDRRGKAHKAKKKRSLRKLRPPNWVAMRERYITCPDVSISQLADENHVTRREIHARSREENWYEEREQFIQLVRDEACQQAASQIAKIAVQRFERMVNQYGEVREKLLERYLAEVSAAEELHVSEQKVESIETDKKDGKMRRTSVKRERPPIDAKLGYTVVSMEMELFKNLLGFGRGGPQGAPADDSGDGFQVTIT